MPSVAVSYVRFLEDCSRLKTLELHPGEDLEFHSAVFTPDAQFILASLSDDSIRVWNSQSGVLVTSLTGPHTMKVMKWNPKRLTVWSTNFIVVMSLVCYWTLNSGFLGTQMICLRVIIYFIHCLLNLSLAQSFFFNGNNNPVSTVKMDVEETLDDVMLQIMKESLTHEVNSDTGSDVNALASALSNFSLHRKDLRGWRCSKKFLGGQNCWEARLESFPDNPQSRISCTFLTCQTCRLYS